MFCFEKKGFHEFCPEHFLILYDSNEFSQVMGITEDMYTIFEWEVWFPVIMNQLSYELFKNTHRFQGFSSTFFVHEICGQELRARNVYPTEILSYMYACLITMKNMRKSKCFLDTTGDNIEFSVSAVIKLQVQL